MAKATYICPRCGKEITITGCNGRDADHKVAYMARIKAVCRECENAAASERSAADAKAMGLPELTGTPKQVAWAETIRMEWISGENGKLKDGPLEWLKSRSEAKWWIEHRELVDMVEAFKEAFKSNN